MKIYQGEPLGGKINIKDGDTYLPSLENITLKAILVNQTGNIAIKWSTEDSTMDIGTETIEEQTAGYAAFSVNGETTSTLPAGVYSMEIAKVLENGKAIGVAKSAVVIMESLIGRE